MNKKISAGVLVAATVAGSFAGAFQAASNPTSTLTITSVNFDVDTTYTATKTEIAEVMNIASTDDSYALIPNSAAVSIEASANYSSSDKSLVLAGTATANDLTEERNKTYTVSDIDMTLDIAGTSYEATYDAATGVISCEYTVPYNTMVITATVKELTITADGATFTIAGDDCTITTDAKTLDFDGLTDIDVDGSASMIDANKEVTANVLNSDDSANVTIVYDIAPVPETGVAGFVERLYTVALGRESDPDGKADWINRVMTEGYTGADLAKGFLYSPEFLDKDTTNEEFLVVLYSTFFNRTPDEVGFNNWLALMNDGLDRQGVIDGFIGSIEFANLCLTFGIASGSDAVPTITVEPSEDILAFAERLYTTALGRASEPEGLAYWSNRIANLQVSGSIAAYGFFFSNEFLTAEVSDEDYVTRLYATFLDREPDTDGYNDWVGQLANGASRETVFNGFANSIEWAGICAGYGIIK